MNDRHGTEGPLQVSDPGHINEFSRWFVQAVQGLGEPFNADFNGSFQRGVGFYQFTNRHGRRSSAAYAFLSAQEKNPNLTVRLHCEVQRVVIEAGRAVGVIYKDKSGALQQVRSEGEVIVASGALVTPKILMLSGIGPASHLASHGIACLVDFPRRWAEPDRPSRSSDHGNCQRPASAITNRARAGACSATACSSSSSARAP